jgi:hypothetical protein
MEIYIVTRSLAQCRPLVIVFFKLELARSRPLENVVFRIGHTMRRCGSLEKYINKIGQAINVRWRELYIKVERNGMNVK